MVSVVLACRGRRGPVRVMLGGVLRSLRRRGRSEGGSGSDGRILMGLRPERCDVRLWEETRGGVVMRCQSCGLVVDRVRGGSSDLSCVGSEGGVGVSVRGGIGYGGVVGGRRRVRSCWDGHGVMVGSVRSVIRAMSGRCGGRRIMRRWGNESRRGRASDGIAERSGTDVRVTFSVFSSGGVVRLMRVG
jgi:hypothetical protein